RTRRTSSITSRRHARRAALAGRRPPGWHRGRPLRRRGANKGVWETLTQSRVVGAGEWVAYFRGSPGSRAEWTKGAPGRNGPGRRQAGPAVAFLGAARLQRYPGFAATPRGRAPELVSQRCFCTIAASCRRAFRLAQVKAAPASVLAVRVWLRPSCVPNPSSL